MTTSELLAELERLGVTLSINGDKLRLEAPVGVLAPALKEAVLKHKQEIMALLSGDGVEEVFWPGVKARVYRARPSCLKAGGCLREADCDLFPLTWRWGYCRERVALTVIPGQKEARRNAG